MAQKSGSFEINALKGAAVVLGVMVVLYLLSFLFD